MARLRIDPADLAVIALGGVAGAMVRERITNPTITGDWFAYAPNTGVNLAHESSTISRVFIVNVVGCLLLGGLTMLLARAKYGWGRRAVVGLSTGFCGSLTTFSAFAVDAAQHLRGAPAVGGPDQIDVPGGLVYLCLSVVAGAIAFALGRRLAKLAAT